MTPPLNLGRMLGWRVRGPHHSEEFDGISLGSVERGGDIRLPFPSRGGCPGLMLNAPTGAGKTIQAAHVLAETYLAAPERYSVLVVSPQGDLARTFLGTLACRSSSVLERVAIGRPFVLGTPPANVAVLDSPLDIGVRAEGFATLVDDLAVATGRGAQRRLGVRQRDVIRRMTAALLESAHPDRSMLWLLDAVEADDGLAALAALSDNGHGLERIKLAEELRASVHARLYSAMGATRAARRVFGAPSCVDFARHLDTAGNIVVLDLSGGPGGAVGEALLQFFSSLYLNLAFDALFSRRPGATATDTLVAIDELPTCSGSAGNVIAAATRGRARGVFLFPAMTQNLGLLPPDLVDVLLTNAAVLTSRTNPDDARTFSARAVPPPGSDDSIGAARGRLSATLSNLPARRWILLGPGDRPRAYRCPEHPVADWDSALAANQAAIERAEARFQRTVQQTSARVTVTDASRSTRPGSSARTSPPRPAVGPDAEPRSESAFSSPLDVLEVP